MPQFQILVDGHPNKSNFATEQEAMQTAANIRATHPRSSVEVRPYDPSLPAEPKVVGGIGVVNPPLNPLAAPGARPATMVPGAAVPHPAPPAVGPGAVAAVPVPVPAGTTHHAQSNMPTRTEGTGGSKPPPATQESNFTRSGHEKR